MTKPDTDASTEETINRAVTRPTIVGDLSELVVHGHKYRTVLADPPWRYDNTSSRGAAANHYQTMTVAEICRQPVSDLVTDHSHLHLWTTNAFLESAFDVMRAWGFEFKSCLVWVKPNIGWTVYGNQVERRLF